jgi:hypothetical protein
MQKTAAPLFLAVCLLATPGARSLWAAEAVKGGSIAGSVTAEVTRQHLDLVLVNVENTSLYAYSDASGRFRVGDVPPGTYRILLTRDGYLPVILSDLVVTAERETPVVARLQEAVQLKDEVTVSASFFTQPEGVTTGAYEMNNEEVRRAPGAVGDIGRMLQSLPSAMTRDDQRNDIVSRGGSPSENLILVDNIEVPNLSHFGGQGATGGPITMLNAETISDVSFLAGGFPAAYGNRLSSVLDISLREGNRQRTQAELDLGMAGAGLLLEGPLGQRGSWLVSGRRGFVDLIASAWHLKSVPQYANFQTKAVYDLGANDRLTFISLGGWDKINFDVDEADLEDANTFVLDDVAWRGVAGLSWQRLLGGQGVLNVSLGHAENDFKVDIWDTLLDDQLVERNRSRERETTLRQDLTLRLGRLGSLRAGGFAKRLGAAYDISMPLGLDNVFSADGTRMNVVTLDEDL